MTRKIQNMFIPRFLDSRFPSPPYPLRFVANSASDLLSLQYNRGKPTVKELSRHKTFLTLKKKKTIKHKNTQVLE